MCQDLISANSLKLILSLCYLCAHQSNILICVRKVSIQKLKVVNMAERPS